MNTTKAACDWIKAQEEKSAPAEAQPARALPESEPARVPASELATPAPKAEPADERQLLENEITRLVWTWEVSSTEARAAFMGIVGLLFANPTGDGEKAMTTEAAPATEQGHVETEAAEAGGL